MGVKLGGGLLRCGTCGKSRGLRHTCVTHATRTRLQPRLTVTCTTCNRVRGIGHICHPKSDFKARLRKRETARKRAKRTARRKKAAAERRERERARKNTANRKRKPRPRGDSHEPGMCGDKECPRFGCKAYWNGMADCPGPHGEG